MAQTDPPTKTIGARDPRFEAPRSFIRGLMRRDALPSVSIAVAKDGKIIWEQGFGWANRETKARTTPDTMYSLASISKSFTAAAVMQLVEQGKIRLDAPADEYLGQALLTGLAGKASGATIRRILSQTSGLPMHYRYFYSDQPYAAPPIETTILHYGILVTPPGAVYQYSNLGYGILGYIISRVSGINYRRYMRRRVFLPLGLTHTSVGIAGGPGPYAARYNVKGRPIPFYTFDHVAASAIYSSAHDLVRFGMFELKDHLAGERPILNNTAIDLTQRPVTPIGLPGTDYALGWFVHPNDHGYLDIFSAGEMPGVSTMLSLYPAANLAVVVLANKPVPHIEAISEQIVAAVLPRYAAALRADPNEFSAPPPEPYKPVSPLAGLWVGRLRTWKGEIALRLDFRPDGEIRIKLGNEPEALLRQPRWNGRKLTGLFPGEIPTPDADRDPTILFAELWLREGKLTGEINAESIGRRPHYSLASFAELRPVVRAE